MYMYKHDKIVYTYLHNQIDMVCGFLEQKYSIRDMPQDFKSTLTCPTRART